MHTILCDVLWFMYSLYKLTTYCTCISVYWYSHNLGYAQKKLYNIYGTVQYKPWRLCTFIASEIFMCLTPTQTPTSGVQVFFTHLCRNLIGQNGKTMAIYTVTYAVNLQVGLAPISTTCIDDTIIYYSLGNTISLLYGYMHSHCLWQLDTPK